jgi:hypothetical protein
MIRVPSVLGMMLRAGRVDRHPTYRVCDPDAVLGA